MNDQSLRFRLSHIEAFFKEWQNTTLPCDVMMANYFRKHAQLGSKDRAWMSELIYQAIRNKMLLDYLLEIEHVIPNWMLRIQKLLHSSSLSNYINDITIPEHIRMSMPLDLYTIIQKNYGEKAFEVASASNKAAPTFLRVNILKTTREALLSLLQEKGVEASPSLHVSTAILVHKKVNFYILPEFRSGLFEVQDENSQYIANLVEPNKHDQILDYCAGSGGKTLAFAYKLHGTGQIFLHDIRKHALEDAKKRLKRAGIQNAQIIFHEEHRKLEKLKKKMDWVFVDVPCSGTGTLRRNPDMKERFSLEMVKNLVSEQRVIFERALSFVKPKGKIIYATCSILSEENQEQIQHFLNTYPIKSVQPSFQSLPSDVRGDGFFAHIFEKQV